MSREADDIIAAEALKLIEEVYDEGFAAHSNSKLTLNKIYKHIRGYWKQIKQKLVWHSGGRWRCKGGLNLSYVRFSGRKQGDELLEEEMDIAKVYWDDTVECHVHKNGMRFDPEDKMYYTWLNTKDEEDSREFFYLLCNGNLLSVRGEIGRNNKSILEDKSLDSKCIYTKFYPFYCLELVKWFRKKIKEGGI